MDILYSDVDYTDDCTVSGTLTDDGTLRTGVFRSDIVLDGIWDANVWLASVWAPFVWQ